jgi:type IV secretory pathway TrbL component
VIVVMMAMVVMVTMLMVVIVMIVVVMMIVSAIVPGDAHVRRGDPGTDDARRLERVVDAERAQRAAQGVERQAGVEQRAQHHVAGHAGKAVEIQDARHQRLMS